MRVQIAALQSIVISEWAKVQVKHLIESIIRVSGMTKEEIFNVANQSGSAAALAAYGVNLKEWELMALKGAAEERARADGFKALAA